VFSVVGGDGDEFGGGEVAGAEIDGGGAVGADDGFEGFRGAAREEFFDLSEDVTVAGGGAGVDVEQDHTQKLNGGAAGFGAEVAGGEQLDAGEAGVVVAGGDDEVAGGGEQRIE